MTLSFIYNQAHSGFIVAHNQGIEVMDCVQCGFAHQYPLPTQAAVDAMYQQDEYVKLGQPDWFKKERGEIVNGDWNVAFKHRLSLMDADTPLLDVGCGTGYLIDYYYHHARFFAQGIEPSPTARREVLYHTSVYDSYASFKQDDVQHPFRYNIHMNLVLEHILDPKAFIRQYMQHLATDGKMVVIVPNEFNPLQQRLRGKHGDWFVQKPHINYFTRDSLRRLLEECGLEVTWQGATFPMELAALVGFDYVGNDELGRKVHRWRLDFERKMGTKAFTLYAWLHRWLGIGRETIAVAGWPKGWYK
jgi:SAM-dependent methyltransferase